MSQEFVPKKQRALVFQGGGSLGAYEAGVFQALYENITKEDEKKEEEIDRPLFDIVAGTSIGAINAAILVSYVAENGTWNGATQKLNEFWDYLSTESYADVAPGFTSWWDYWHNVGGNIAAGEAARRYYSAKQFELSGVPNVFSPLPPLVDDKFLDAQNMWYRYDNYPLKTTIERFAKFPIATNYDENNQQPRLLLVSVDVQEGATVTFDSYLKEGNQRKSEYGKYGAEFSSNGKKEGYEHVIIYNEGIKSDYVIASASVPINFNYTTIEAEKRNSKQKRYFWDGGLLSNTPLREVLEAHRNYWFKMKKYGTTNSKHSVPDLEIYIIDLHPTKQDSIPIDHDGVVNRNNDITFHDRTTYDKKVALLVADYINFTNELIKVAKDNGVSQGAIDKVLNKEAKSKHRTGEIRIYQDLLEGRFNIDKIVRIERKNDANTISNKIFDFSGGTVRQLRENGYRETIDKLNLLRKVHKS